MPGAVTGGRRRAVSGPPLVVDAYTPPAAANPRARRFTFYGGWEPRLPMPECLMTSKLDARAHAREAATTKRRGVPSRRGEPGA